MGPGCGGRAGTASVAQPLATIASPKHTAHRRRAALLHPLEQRSRRRRPWVGVVLSRVRRPLAQRDAVGALPRIGDAAVAKHHIPPRKLLRGRGRGRDEGVLAADRRHECRRSTATPCRPLAGSRHCSACRVGSSRACRQRRGQKRRYSRGLRCGERNRFPGGHWARRVRRPRGRQWNGFWRGARGRQWSGFRRRNWEGLVGWLGRRKRTGEWAKGLKGTAGVLAR